MSDSKANPKELKERFFHNYRTMVEGTTFKKFVSQHDVLQRFKDSYDYVPFSKSVDSSKRISLMFSGMNNVDLSEEQAHVNSLQFERDKLDLNHGSSDYVKVLALEIDDELNSIADKMEFDCLSTIRSEFGIELSAYNHVMLSLKKRSLASIEQLAAVAENTLDDLASVGLVVDKIYCTPWTDEPVGASYKKLSTNRAVRNPINAKDLSDASVLAAPIIHIELRSEDQDETIEIVVRDGTQSENETLFRAEADRNFSVINEDGRALTTQYFKSFMEDHTKYFERIKESSRKTVTDNSAGLG